MEASWHQDVIQNRRQLRNADLSKNLQKQWKIINFEVLGGLEIIRKTIKNLAKIASQIGLRFATVFFTDLDRFLEPSWEAKSTKIDPRRHRKSNEKKKGTWMSKNIFSDPIPTRDPPGPEPRGGGRGRGKPLPRGVVGLLEEFGLQTTSAQRAGGIRCPPRWAQ